MHSPLKLSKNRLSFRLFVVFLLVNSLRLRAVGSVNFVAADFNPPRGNISPVLSAVGTVHLDKQLILKDMYRAYGTQKWHCNRSAD